MKKQISSRLRFKLILPFVILAVSGCTKFAVNTGTSAAYTNTPQTLTYCTWEDEEGYAEKLAEAFEAENPGITVNIKYISAALTAKELSSLLDKEDIDIIGLKNINVVLSLAKNHKIKNITGHIASSGIDGSHYGNMYNDVSIEGEYYCLPTRKTSWVLAYNKDIFKKEGLNDPGQMTWDEYASLAKQLTKGSGEEKQWGGYFVNWVYNFMGIQEKNYLYDDDLIYVQKSLEFMNRIYNEDKSHMTPKEMEQESWLEAFENGNIAMMPQGEWFVGMILEDEKSGKTDVDWDIAPMPVRENQKTGTTWGLYQLASISSKCARTDTAFEFLKFLCGEKGAELYASNGMIPAYTDAKIQNTYRSAIGNHNADAFFHTYQIQEKPAYEGYADLEDMLEKEAVLYLNGKQSIEITMQNFKKAREEYYAKK